jgi:hypothetical protein
MSEAPSGEPPPPELRPRTSDIATHTVVIESTLSGGGLEVSVKFVQFEPSGRVVEYQATLNRAEVLRDIGPAVDFAASVDEGLLRDRAAAAAERRRAGSMALAARPRPY